MAFMDNDNEEYWIPLADVMTGLMLVFMLIAVAFMLKANYRETKMRKELEQTQRKTSLYELNRQGIAKSLESEFGAKLSAWHASFESTDLVIKFNSPEVIFDVGKDELKPDFKKILNDFFPQYLKIIELNKNRIASVSVDGYASSFWGRKVSDEDAYFLNMHLSQQRAGNVLYYLHEITKDPSMRQFLRNNFTANGYSSSHLVTNLDGSEDYIQSQRVEFKIILKK